MFSMSAAIDLCMYSSYACASGVCRRGCCGVCGFVGVTSARFCGGEKKPGTGDFRGTSCAGGGKIGPEFFSGDGGRGIRAAIFTEPVDGP